MIFTFKAELNRTKNDKVLTAVVMCQATLTSKAVLLTSDVMENKKKLITYTVSLRDTKKDEFERIAEVKLSPMLQDV